MNRMNYNMGSSANGRQMTKRNPEPCDGRCQISGQNPNFSENRSRAACRFDTGRCPEEVPSDLSVGNRRALLSVIDEEGFASYEAVLYLDTHPDDPDARDYFHLHNHRYQTAVREYGRLYGPLTIDTASASPSETWNWMQQPWPWEGGDC